MIDQALLLLRIGVLVLLYLFVWRIARTAIRDVRGSSESMILSPGHGFDPQPAPVAAPAIPFSPGRLVVVASDILPIGAAVVLDQPEVLLGRDPRAAAVLDGDDFVSGRHAMVRARGGAPTVTDLGSTNGTYVNGDRIAAETPLHEGDELAVGSTRMVYEPGVDA
ncbi:MAG: FHA domain-containing protein [Thermoleophilia bacterium]